VWHLLREAEADHRAILHLVAVRRVVHLEGQHGAWTETHRGTLRKFEDAGPRSEAGEEDTHLARRRMQCVEARGLGRLAVRAIAQEERLRRRSARRPRS